ncbi:copper chaperone PCu(A)C [Streptomyces sp. CWNU-52B]|uniref:copper chaperone PCu(A)C n=1 Tax=unclassified Streptomyces TaxID=2593676 RepID=UPI0039C2A9E5
MSSSLRRGALAAAAIAFSLASLTACGAGHKAQTLEIKPDNAATTVGDIKIQNAVVITQPEPESAGPAAVTATLFNSGRTAQTLESIAVEGAGQAARLKPAKGSAKVTVPAGGSLVLGGKDNASAVLESSDDAFKDGDAHPVTFTFSKTGDVKLEAFVVPAKGYFSDWGPTEAPVTPGTEPSASGSESGAATGSPSGTPSGAASGSASGETEEAGEAGAHASDAASASADAAESAAGN